eukprot:1039663-Rhodomonas_salina.3
MERTDELLVVQAGLHGQLRPNGPGRGDACDRARRHEGRCADLRAELADRISGLEHGCARQSHNRSAKERPG